MGTRQEDPNRTPSSQRKRPLSIIEEYDSDDSTAAKSNKHDEERVYAFAENIMEVTNLQVTSLSGDGNVNDQNVSPIKEGSKVLSGRGRIPEVNCETKSISNGPTVSSKSHPSITLTTTTSKSSTPQSGTISSPASPPPDSKIPVLKTRGGRRSALTPNENGHKTSGFDRSTEKQFQDSKSLRNSPSADTQKGMGQNRFETQTNDCSKLVADGLGLARIRETAERLNLTSSSQSQPPLPLLNKSPSPNINHRFKFSQPTSQRTIPEVGNFSSIPQITVTPSGSAPSIRVCDSFGSPTSDVHDNENFSDIDSKNNNSSFSPSLSSYLSKLNSSKHGSSFFNRRLSTESTGSLSEGEISDGSSNAIESPESTQLSYISDLKKLQETTEKLRLSTRRPSTMLWRQQYMDSPGFPRIKPKLNGDAPDERLTTDRKQRIDEALEWLRTELQDMRSQDQNLARQLLTIRHDIHQLKLRRCTEEHQDLIDDFQNELEELQEFSDVLDLPKPAYGNNPLKHIGVTRLNMSARRFSAC